MSTPVVSSPVRERAHQLAARLRAVQAWAVQAWIDGDRAPVLAVYGPLGSVGYLLVWRFPEQVARLAFACAVACALATFVAWSVLAYRRWRS